MLFRSSCWNHGNAHFLRGVLRELIALGHDVQAYEPEGAWSLENLRKDHGEEGLQPWRDAYPELSSTSFAPGADLEPMVDGADLVIVHEWNDPALVAEIGRLRRSGHDFTLLFHDTHHRAVSDPNAIRAFDLSNYDGVLAFGEALAEVYRRWGWGDRVVPAGDQGAQDAAQEVGVAVVPARQQGVGEDQDPHAAASRRGRAARCISRR